ncbi:MAG: hypothetical protein P1V97_07840 [Planctomycetota bacterium]|nr:hypothetical protein [Planctomycetota bacterium]
MSTSATPVNNPEKSRYSIILKILTGVFFAVLIFLYLPFIAAAASFDSDEMAQAHIVWLVSTGLVPNADFGEFHPPLAWYYFRVLGTVLPDWPDKLIFFRIYSAILNLVFIAGIMLNGAVHFEKKHRAWFILAGALLFTVIDHSVVVIQFRPDVLSNAILMGAAYLFRLDKTRGFQRSAIFAFLAMFALLLTPRFVIFVVALSLFDLISDWKHGLSVFKQIGAYILGILSATLLIASIFAALNMNLFENFWLCLEFHRHMIERVQGEYGLILKLLSERVYFAFIVTGFLCFLIHRKLSLKDCEFEWAAAVFVCGQCLLIQVDFRHYVFHCAALATVFIPYIGVAVTNALPKVKNIVLCLGIFYGISALAFNLQLVNQDRNGQKRHLQFLLDLKNIKKDGGYVIAATPFRPIDEHDVFYNLFTFRKEVEVIMTTEMKSNYEDRYTEDFYWAELNRNKPSLITMRPSQLSEPSVMNQTIKKYLRLHRDEYRKKRIPFGHVGEIDVWVHKDQLRKQPQ